MLMEEGSVSPERTITERTGTSIGVVDIDRDQAVVELTFVMDERDRMSRQARLAAAERDRLADQLRLVEAERDQARATLSSATAERSRLVLEIERIQADLAAAGRAMALANEEIAWLRALTEQLTLQERNRNSGP